MPRTDWHPGERLSVAVEAETVGRAIPLAAASAVYVGYLIAHPYPAYGAGLFLESAEQIAATGYRLPTRIPGYTAEGVPFAYPPLAFYILALLVDGLGVDPIAVTRFLPGLLVIASLLPFHGIASELTASRRQATLATLLVATAPPVLQWHLSAGGVVRTMAFLFALSSLYAGVRLFRTHAPSWAAVGTVSFATVVLTHPTYAAFVVVSYLAAYVSLDRSLRGLASGAVVALGGLVLAAPWWLQVAAVHGFDVFFAASGTHGGLGADPVGVWGHLTAPFEGGAVQWPFYALVYLGAITDLRDRRWFLPGWMLATAFFLGVNRFLFVPGSILAARFVFEALVPAVRSRLSGPTPRRLVPAAMATIVALAAVTAGTLYGAGVVAGIRGDGAAQPVFADADDHAAMDWVERNTPADATFVALGDAAEWLPFVADRTILIGPWGAEWESTSAYYTQYERYEAISTCRDAACIARSLDRADVRPDYVYVPKGRYTVRDKAYVQAPTMAESLASSEEFRVVFENEGVVIAAVDDASATHADRASDSGARKPTTAAARAALPGSGRSPDPYRPRRVTART